jgi:ferric-dicitrate binding protein FerR (iron transport regulator)
MNALNDILARYFAGEATAEERVQVEDWKAANEAEFEELQRSWNAIDKDLMEQISVQSFDTSAAWKKVESAIAAPIDTKIIRLKFYRKVAAACAVLLIGLGAFWFLSRTSMEVISNQTAGQMDVILPDGSHVWLAENTTLEYHENFTENRSLNLKGEAFFEVTKDPAHPFVVATEFGEIKVLGTAFNVVTKPNETVVSVDHGRVAVSNEKGSVEITVGEQTAASENGVSKPAPASVNFDSWKTGVFIFEDALLSEVIETLNSHYAKKIKLVNESKNNELYTGSWENKSIHPIIQSISRTCNVTADSSGSVIELR